jgi:uncharacterized membrane protein YqjE
MSETEYRLFQGVAVAALLILTGAVGYAWRLYKDYETIRKDRDKWKEKHDRTR